MRQRVMAWGGWIVLGVALVARAEEPLAQRLPPGALAAVEWDHGAVLIERLQKSPILKAAYDSAPYQAWANSNDGKKFRGGRAVLEGQLAMNLWEATSRMLGDRSVLAIYPPQDGSNKPASVWITRLADAEIGPHLKQRLEPLVNLAGEGVAASEQDGGWQLVAKDGNRAWLKDRWLVISSNSATLFDSARQSLLNPPPEKSPEPVAWGLTTDPAADETRAAFMVDGAAIRRLIHQDRLAPAQLDNPVGSLLLGGVIEQAGVSQSLTGTLTIKAQGYALDVRLVGEAIDAAHQTLLTTQLVSGAEALPVVPRRLATLTIFRDWQNWYRQRDALLEAKVLPEFDKFETGIATFLPGKDFAEDVLGLMSGQLTVVAAEQTYGHLPKPPGMQLPAFAVVVGLKDAQRGADIFNLFFQTVASLSNLSASQQMRQPWLMSSETYKGVQISFARYLDAPKGDAVPVIYNAQPASAVVGSSYVAASSVELCRDLVDALQAQAAGLGSGQAVKRNTEFTIDPATAARMLGANQALVEARMVQDGQTTDNATQLRTWVEGLLGAQAPIRLTTDAIDRGLQVKLEGSWK